jgi:hypothetical protein
MVVVPVFISSLAFLWGVISWRIDGDLDTLGIASLLTLFLVGPLIVN